MNKANETQLLVQRGSCWRSRSSRATTVTWIWRQRLRPGPHNALTRLPSSSRAPSRELRERLQSIKQSPAYEAGLCTGSNVIDHGVNNRFGMNFVSLVSGRSLRRVGKGSHAEDYDTLSGIRQKRPDRADDGANQIRVPVRDYVHDALPSLRKDAQVGSA